MWKTVYLEKSLKAYLKTLESDSVVHGLLLGQNSADSDFIVHLTRTQIPKDSPNTVYPLKQISYIREEWIIDHIRNVIQMLPGGMSVLGLFFVSKSDVFGNSTSVNTLKNILLAVNKFITQNEYYFVDSFSTQKLVLHYTNDSELICKRFTSSQNGCFFDPVEFVIANTTWDRISCFYDFEHLLPVYVKSISNAILHDKIMEILKYVSKSVKESVLVFNGEIRNSKELIKNIKEKLNKQISQNISHSESTTQILVDLYAPCVQQFPCESSQTSDYMAELKCYGTLCSEVYMHDKSTVADAVKAVKEDIIRSLYSRLIMHCNSLLEDLNTSSPDETKIIHEPPRRISVLLPYSKVRFTDYLFPGEENLSTLPAREQLDINNIDDDRKLYEPLEVETDAAEFYNVDSPTSLVTESSETRKSYLHYVYSLGVIILVLMIAIIFQYFSSKR
ncbi:hypothetical protein V9T40_005485 [Parthenolecanium corni]|uniref:Protein odr-4 homolog n=1 Tax=Parthenolecanium corni TaxID=536013 RepID=A0AAN9TGX8_9HEMI